MPVKLNSSSGGSVTLQEPTTASNYTLSLPAQTGTVITDDGSGNIKFNSGYGSNATAYGCRAWVNFNGTGTVAIRASGNVSSITDNATGEYTLNFTNAMPDTNYIITGNQRISGGYSLLYPAFTEVAPTTTTAKIYTGSTNLGGNVDPPYVFVAVFR